MSDVPGQPPLANVAFAFRGYNTTNLGRTPEMLAHPEMGPVVARWLREASGLCAETTGQQCDLVERVRARRESTLDSFAEDIALIVSVEMAQVELLRERHGIDYRQARWGLGYSLGEISALTASGVFAMRSVLPPLMSLAAECAELARHTTMGVVFSKGPSLATEAIQRLCVEISSEGRGIVAISSFLAPNTLLLLGEHGTVDRFRERMRDALGPLVHLRKNSEHWPPLHTPILWHKAIPNRAAEAMFHLPGGFRRPDPPVLSLVTGKLSYNDYNSRDLLNRWIDHPQRLWDAVYAILEEGIETVVHVGPDPNLIPATFKRLSDNVTAQLRPATLNNLGLRAMSGIVRRPWVRRPWLAKLISSRAALLRAPLVEHVIAEDLLLRA